MTQTKKTKLFRFVYRKGKIQGLLYKTRHSDIWVFTGPTDITSGEGIQDTLLYEFSTGEKE